MRISIALLLFVVCCGFAPVAAQHTFDVKYPIYSSSGADYGGLLRITPTKILANSNDGYTKPILITLDNDGMITRQVKLDFNIGTSPFYWYNSDSNIIYMLIPEDLRKNPGYPLHLIRLDTNLNIKSDIVLDSNVTGVASEYNRIFRQKGIVLKDSTLLISAGYLVGYTYTKKLVAYRFSRSGKLLSRYIFDSTSTFENPLFQTLHNVVVWEHGYTDSLKQYRYGFWMSDTAFIFNPTPILPIAPPYNSDAYDRKSLISTSDSGIAFILPHLSVWPPVVTLTKYDSIFRKQWEVSVLGGGNNRALQLIESPSGGYYIINQTITDTSLGDISACFLDIALSRIDASGKYLFTAHYGSGTCQQLPTAVMQDDDGGIIISGRYNIGNDTQCQFTCNEQDSTWIFKVDTLGRPARTITGIKESNPWAMSMRLYPNPSSNELTVEFGAAYYTGIEIVDIEGRTIQYFPLNDAGQTSAIINIATLPSGNYYCRLRARTASMTRPFVIQR